MTAAAKAVVKAFFDHNAKGEGEAAFALLAPDVRYTLTGSTPLSGTFNGMPEVMEKLIGPLMERLEVPIVLSLRELIAEGDRVVALATGKAVGKHGRYDNTYSFVFTVRDGKIVSLEEYLDTVLVETALYGRKLV